MFKKISIYFLSIILFSIVFWTLIRSSSDLIFSTNAGLDGEPHKAKYIFGGWFALLLTGFILSLVYLPKGRK